MLHRGEREGGKLGSQLIHYLTNETKDDIGLILCDNLENGTECKKE